MHQQRQQQQGEGKNTDSLFLVQEFGTIPALFVGRSLILENMVYHWDRRQKEWGRWLMVSAPFYPQKTECWRANIVQRGVDLVTQAMIYAKDNQPTTTTTTTTTTLTKEEEPHEQLEIQLKNKVIH
jgi:hypothetical protein